MTVPLNYTPTISVGNGVTTVFPYSFKIVDKTHLVVTVNGVVKTVDVDYTVSGVGSESGGNCTFIAAPTNGYGVTIYRDVPVSRDTDYQNNGDLSANTLNSDIDAVVMMIQDVSYNSVRFDNDTARVVHNISDGIEINDAATVGQVGDLVNAAAIAGGGMFQQAGTGAIQQPIQQKLREAPASPVDYGGVGDGVADDKAAIDLAATQHARVDLLGRTWKCTGYFIKPTATEIINGTIIDSNGTIVYPQFGYPKSTSIGINQAAVVPADVQYALVTIDGKAMRIPYYPVADALDLFIIVGQSNAEGRGDYTLSPAAPNGLYFNGSSFDTLVDPVGDAITGSAWPSFSNEWFVQSTRKSIFVEAARGGTSILPDATGYSWSPIGDLRGQAVAAARTAITAINASLDKSLGNVYFLWCQGESEGANSNGTTITGPLYEQGLEDLAAYFKAQIPEMTQMAVIQTGQDRSSPSQLSGYKDVRLAQENACNDSANLTMVYRGGFSAWSTNPVTASGVHYTQAHYNRMGKCAAIGLKTPPSVPTAPSFTANSYLTGSYSSISSRTQAHTTPAGTKAIAVVVSAVRAGSSTTVSLDSITFNGVALNKCREFASASASPACRAQNAVYFINETEYGSSLASVTANIVITDTSVYNLITFAVYNFGSEVWADNHTELSTDVVSSIVPTITNNQPAVIVGVFSGMSAGAAALTVSTLSGMTQQLFESQTNGTRVGSVLVGHYTQTVSAFDYPVTFTLSGTCDDMGTCMVAFRKRAIGE